VEPFGRRDLPGETDQVIESLQYLPIRHVQGEEEPGGRFHRRERINSV